MGLSLTAAEGFIPGIGSLRLDLLDNHFVLTINPGTIRYPAKLISWGSSFGYMPAFPGRIAHHKKQR